MPTIVLKQVRFWTHLDEFAFEEWATRLPCVTATKWVGDELRLTIPRRRMAHESLRGLVGLFMRYRINRMDQLAQFLNASNRRWFADTRKDYHHLVFPNGVPPP